MLLTFALDVDVRCRVKRRGPRVEPVSLNRLLPVEVDGEDKDCDEGDQRSENPSFEMVRANQGRLCDVRGILLLVENLDAHIWELHPRFRSRFS